MRPFRRLSAVCLLVLAVAGACAAEAASFDPTGPCAADGQAAGAYPDLEALIPGTFEGKPPTELTSGRNCTERNLGTMAAAGVREVRHAGGVWELGDRSGATLAVMEARNLTEQVVADFYEAGARAGRRTEDVTRGEVATGIDTWSRVDTLNGESFQTIVAMEYPAPGRVHLVLVASDVREIPSRDAHEDRVARAIETWESVFPVE